MFGVAFFLLNDMFCVSYENSNMSEQQQTILPLLT